MSSPGAVIRSVALASALGPDLAAALPGLRRGAINTVSVEIDQLSERLCFPYYRIPDDAALFSYARLEAWMRRVADAALEAAGLDRAERAALPLLLGSTSFQVALAEERYQDLLRENPTSTEALPLAGHGRVTEELAQALGTGPQTWAFNTACTAGANALLAGLRFIAAGRFRHVLVLGAETANLTTLAGFAGLQLLAPELRPFDRRRAGIVLGESVAAVVLSAEGRGPRLLEGASNSDPFSIATANPDGTAIAQVLHRALANAGVKAADIVAVKAHATGSALNDEGEAAALCAVLPKRPPLMALKSYLGHSLGACGVSELALLYGALTEGFLPGTPTFREADPALGWEPLRSPVPAPDGHYLLNAFGFGGSNTALVLRTEAPC